MNLRLPQVKVQSPPALVFSAPLFAKLIGRRSVVVGQSIIVDAEVAWHPVRQNPDVFLVAGFHEVLQVSWLPIGVLQGKVANRLVAPGGVQRVRRQRQKLNVVEALLLNVRNQFLLQVFQRIQGAILMLLPGIDVHLINVDWPREVV